VRVDRGTRDRNGAVQGRADQPFRRGRHGRVIVLQMTNDEVGTERCTGLFQRPRALPSRIHAGDTYASSNRTGALLIPFKETSPKDAI
jgi:hypothetical protein